MRRHTLLETRPVKNISETTARNNVFIIIMFKASFLSGDLVDRLGQSLDIGAGDASNRDSAVLGGIDGVLYKGEQRGYVSCASQREEGALWGEMI